MVSGYGKTFENPARDTGEPGLLGVGLAHRFTHGIPPPSWSVELGGALPTPARLCLRISLLRLRRIEPAVRITLTAQARIGGLGGALLGIALRVPTELKKRAEEVAVVPARHGDVSRRRLARDEAPLRLVAQHRDELGTIVGLFAQRLIRDDDG